MNWQFLLGINLLCGVIRETFNKRISQKTDPFVSVLYIFTINGFIYLLLQFFLHGFTLTWRWETVASGLLFTISYLCYYFAVRISLAQSILFSSYSLIITIILSAIFLGEGKYFDIAGGPGIKVIAGLLLASIALWYLLHEGRKSQVLLEKKWFVFIIATIILMGAGSFMSIYSLRVYHLGTFEVLINQTIGALPFLFVWDFLFRRDKFPIPLASFFDILINVAATSGSVIAFFQLVRQMPAAKLLPIQTIFLIILTIISGIVIFKEGRVITGKRLLGIILGLFGIILLSTA